MFLPLELFTQSIRSHALASCKSALQMQASLIEEIIDGSVSEVSVSKVLNSVAQTVKYTLRLPADRAVDSVWGEMMTRRKFDQSWNMSSADVRREVAARAWAELSSSQTGTAVSGIFAASDDGSFTGFSCNTTGRTEASGVLWDAPPGGSPLTSRWTDFSTGLKNGPLIEASFETARVTSHMKLDQGTKVRRAWSPVILTDSELSMYWTSPIAYCGSYSCMEGVVSAEVSLRGLSRACGSLWREGFGGAAEALGRNMSNMFVVVQTSRFQQEGLLLAESQWNEAACPTLRKAVECPEGLVRSASMAVLEEYGSWDASDLISSSPRLLMSFSPTERKKCDEGREDCYLLAVRSIELDPETRWLVLAVLPSDTLLQSVAQQKLNVDTKVVALEESSMDVLEKARATGRNVLVAMTVLSIAMSLVMGQMVAKPLRHLTDLMSRLSELDFSTESALCNDIRKGRRRSRILDVAELQTAFCRLARGIGTFARFVPETVVRNIVRLGDHRATRLEVSRREVTIMCTDIAGFTSITEKLVQRDLLYILVRYFSVMMRVVELYGGVVSEILGDGLIVFWNAPDTVDDHSGKACAAALTQQQALQMVNEELQILELPSLTIRIGIHTGSSLIGNIGSKTKMKYGCLGDTKQLAMKLEDLCKHYGVNVICSSATKTSTIPEMFLFRELDYMQVQNDSDPITLFEVICRDVPEIEEAMRAATRPSPGSIRHIISDAISSVYSWASESSRTSHQSTRVNNQSSLPSLGPQMAHMTELQRRRIENNPARREMMRWLYMAQQEELGGPIRSPGVISYAPNDNNDNPSPVTSFVSGQDNKATVVTPDQRRHVGLYESALKAYHSGNYQECMETVQILLAEKDDPPARKLLERAGHQLAHARTSILKL
ncbi:unnamed protein product [Effrenium voratum]|nr:unnamed protein product [Effrenium voratum]